MLLNTNDFKIGDKVMKISGNPFIFHKERVAKFELNNFHKLFFTGNIVKLYFNYNKTILYCKIKNGNYSIKDIDLKDIKLIDQDHLLSIWKIWRGIKLALQGDFDYRFSCNTDFHRKPKPKEKFESLYKAKLAAFSLQRKNLFGKKYLVYKCSNCNNYHVGSEQNAEILELLEKNMLPLTGLS